jgi:hypothetical protein
MRRISIPFSMCFCEDLKVKPTKRFFQSFVSNNGKDNFMIIENRFPADAKVVGIIYNRPMEIFYIIVESKEYPDVEMPTQVNPIIMTLDKKKEKVAFT